LWGNVHISIRLFQPKTDKERLFQIEARVLNEIKNPSEACFTLDGKEYVIEIRHDELVTVN